MTSREKAILADVDSFMKADPKLTQQEAILLVIASGLWFAANAINALSETLETIERRGRPE